MKLFEKPIVVLNEMMMNESIASSACCYVSGAAGNVALNGGQFQASYTYGTNLKQMVLGAFGGIAPASSYHYKLTLSASGGASGGLTRSFISDSPAGPGDNYVDLLGDEIIFGEDMVSRGGWSLSKSYPVVRLSQGEIGSLTMISFIDNDPDEGPTLRYLGVGDIPTAFNNLGKSLTWGMIGRSLSNPQLPWCNHLTADCPWVVTTTYKPAHINSTIPHLFGGVGWSQPHKAVAYAS